MAMMGRSSIGKTAIAVRRASMRSMKNRAKAPPAMVLVRYMIAGPTAIRTALTSFVRRAMRSPVRVRE